MSRSCDLWDVRAMMFMLLIVFLNVEIAAPVQPNLKRQHVCLICPCVGQTVCGMGNNVLLFCFVFLS